MHHYLKILFPSQYRSQSNLIIIYVLLILASTNSLIYVFNDNIWIKYYTCTANIDTLTLNYLNFYHKHELRYNNNKIIS